MMKHPIRKTLALALVLVLTMALVACGGGRESSSIFPSVGTARIPEILEKSVGTVGSTSYTTGIKDVEGHSAVLTATFEGTTEVDYTTLMNHYQATSTGMDADGYLLFDWGRLMVVQKVDSITITALIK